MLKGMMQLVFPKLEQASYHMAYIPGVGALEGPHADSLCSGITAGN